MGLFPFTIFFTMNSERETHVCHVKYMISWTDTIDNKIKIMLSIKRKFEDKPLATISCNRLGYF